MELAGLAGLEPATSWCDPGADVNLTQRLTQPGFRSGWQGEVGLMREADARTRTGDPFITSEVLYQLSYVGRRA